MKKRFLSILLTLSLLLTFLPTLPLTAYAVGNYGVNLDSDAYYSYTNPFYSVVLRTGQEQCTWYCWGRAYELFGIDLPYRGNANTWNYSSGSLIYDSTPAAHSIAVWTSGDPGHVAYVEAIEGDIIYLTEANLDNCDYTEGYQNTTTGYYVNTSGNLSFDTWKNRSTPDGYIHLPIIDSGTCGNSVSWALTSDGVFSVFGSGAMNDYEAYNEMPWYDHLDAIDKVIISNGITHTGDGAFDGCTNLKEIKLSNTIETMGSSFTRCYGLESVTIPYGVKELRGTFARCFNLKEVTLPDSLLNIGDSTFNNCRSLKTITIPDGVTEFGSATFSESAIESIMIPNNVTEIGDDCFSRCTNLSHISLPNNITHIKYHTFGYCSNLSSVVIPNSVTYIDRDAFCYCIGLKRITIPDGIPSIGGGTFEGCSDLISVNLPSSITKVEGSAFNYCDSLIEVFYRGSRLEWEATAIGEYNAPLADAVIHYNYFVSDDIDTNDENVSEGISVTDAFSKAKENNRAVTINSDSSVIVFDSNAVNQISGQNVVFKMDYAQGDVDDAELVMNIHLDGATFEKGFAKVTTVFEKTAPDGKTAKLYYIDNAGHMTDMHADFEDNKVSFVTSHFSTFAVIFDDELCPQGHTPDVKVIENEVAPTCEIDGKYDEVVYCSICHTELSREISIVPAIGHDWNEGTVTTPATCTTDGIRTYTCKHDASHTYTEAISATGHTPASAVIENETAATCEVNGSYDEVVYCSVCHAEISRETTTVPAIGHDWDKGTVTTPATCTMDGVRTHTCKHDASHTYTEAIPATGHTPAEAVRENEVAPTCSTAGSYDEVVYCSVCHEEVSREQKTIPIDEDAHDWGEWIQTKAPTETEPGEETRTCKNDPSHTETRDIPALGPSQVELSFLDDEVIIVVPNSATPDGSEFDVQKIVPPPAEVVEKVKEQMGASSEVLAYYEVRLTASDGSSIIHLDGEITIKVKMPEQYVGSKCVRILQEDETGKLIVMESWWEGEYLCYKTDWLEIYD